MTDKKTEFISLAGQVLIATPTIDDDRFEKAVIYISAHTEETGAMGIVINQLSRTMTFYEICEQLNIPFKHLKIIPPVLIGGPAQQSRGFILHSDEYPGDLSLSINNGILLTTSQDILREIAADKGPKECVIALGCATWQAGQLEEELMSNIWMTAPASHNLLFHAPIEEKWDIALASIGVQPAFLSNEFGKA